MVDNYELRNMNEEWVEVELGSIFNITYGKGLPTKKLLQEGYPVFGANGVIGCYSEFLYSKKQVLISCRGAASGTINISPEKCFVTNNSLIIENHTNKVINKFLYFILSGSNRSKIVTGTAQPQVTINNANPILIKIAPLPIQKAIVSKIETLLSDLDNGIANLKKAQEQLKIYRQAVLKKAFEGELTKEWRALRLRSGTARALSGVEVPTAKELLQQIKEERKKNYELQITNWKKAVKEWDLAVKMHGRASQPVKTHGRASQPKKPTKPKAIKELPPLTEDELKELKKLPDEWIWCKIGDLGTVGTGATPKRGNPTYWVNGNIPWVTSGALNNEFVKDCKEFVTTKALEETNIKIFPKHTLLMAMYGEGKTRGKSSALLIEATTNQAIAGIVQNGIEANIRKYLKLFLIKNYQDIRRKSSGGVQPNINLDIVKNTAIALCSLNEQIQIIQEIENRLSVCDKMEKILKTEIERSRNLRQSILKKAFEGRLLSEAEVIVCKQEEDYEPASVLLARIERSRNEKIKADKVKTQNSASKQKTKKKTKK